MTAGRMDTPEPPAAPQAEMNNIVVGLARVEGSLTAHIASPHFTPSAPPRVVQEVPHGS